MILILICALVMGMCLGIIHEWSGDKIEDLEAKRKDLEEKLAESEAKLAEAKEGIKQILATAHGDDYAKWDQALDAAIEFINELEKTE
jgi:F0F1-type ATP synthase membrane subunit b/b'